MRQRQTRLSALKSRLVYWLPAIFVAALISAFSTHYFSDQQTARVIIPILRKIFPHASAHLLRLMHIGIRKLAHITEFGVFSITVFRGIRGPRYGWRWTWALATFVIAVAYAGFDEWHQSFVPLRHASPRDVAIDAFGALLAQGLVWLFASWKAHPPLTSNPRQQG
jgi:VanZ family protein